MGKRQGSITSTYIKNNVIKKLENITKNNSNREKEKTNQNKK